MAESLEQLAELWEKGVISGDEYVVRKYQASRVQTVSKVVTVSAAGAGAVKFGKVIWAAAFTGAAALGVYGAMRSGSGSAAVATEAEEHPHRELTGSSGPHLDGMPRVVLSEQPLAVTHTGHRTRASTRSEECGAEDGPDCGN